MLFELPAPSLRIFQRATACLARLGRDTAVILRPEEIVLHGADDAHSVAVQFAFRRRFFSATPLSRGSAVADDGSDESRAVVPARALLVAVRGSQQRADGLLVGISGIADGEPRLLLEFVRNGGVSVRHRVPLLDQCVYLPGEPVVGPHSAALSPALLGRVLDHCAPPTSRGSGGCEEVTLSAVPGEGLRVQSHDLLGSGATGIVGGGGAQSNRTEVLVQRSDLEVCNLDQAGGEVTFPGRGLREFSKATDASARDLEVLGLAEGSPLLELRFGSEGAPTVLCRLAAAADGAVRGLEDFTAVLLLATRDALGASQQAGVDGVPGPLSQVSFAAQGVAAGVCGSSSSQSRRPQPRQGPKRRALAAPTPAAFASFPDHGSSQLPQTQMQLPPSTVLAPGTSAVAAQADGTMRLVGDQPVLAPRSLMQLPMQSPVQANGFMSQARIVPAAHAVTSICPPTAPTNLVTPVAPPSPVQQRFSAPVQPLWQQAVQAAPRSHSQAQVHSQFQGHLQSMGQPQAVSLMPQVHTNLQAHPQLQSHPSFLPSAGEGSRAPVQPHIAPRSNAPAARELPPHLPSSLAVPNGHAVAQHAVGHLPPGGATKSLVPDLRLSGRLLGEDSDDDMIGADRDEVAFARGDAGEDSADWFDMENLW